MADKSTTPPAAQVQQEAGRVCGYTPGMGRVEIQLKGDLPDWLELGEAVHIATHPTGDALGAVIDRGPWRRNGARFYSDDFTHDVSLVVGGDFGSDEVEDRYLDWLLSVLNGHAGAALRPSAGEGEGS